MPLFFTDVEYAIIQAACALLIPTDQDPGATEAGVVDYIDGLLGAFATDPPRIWGGGAFSGRFGGEATFDSFHRLNASDELAWRTRLEGSQGIPERERIGPVVGLQERYRAGLSELGADFLALSDDERYARLKTIGAFAQLLYEHACEGMYAAPEYGGNRDLAGWRYIGFAGDVQPRGYSDEDVSGP